MECKRKFSLEELADCYRIRGVEVRESFYVVDLAKKHVASCADRGQYEWMTYSRGARLENDFAVGSMPLYFSLFKSLYDNRECAPFGEQIENIRAELSSRMNGTLFSTLSEVRYRQSGDQVCHNIGQSDEFFLEGRMGVSNLNLRDVTVPNECCYLLLGSRNAMEINDVFKWISGKDTFLRRLDSSWGEFSNSQVLFGEGYSNEGRFTLIADGSKDLIHFDDDHSELLLRPAISVRYAIESKPL